MTTRPWVRGAVFVLLIAVAAGIAWRLGFFQLRDPARLASAIQRARMHRGVIPLFVGAYALIATFGLPATPLTLAGGAMFGLGLGSVLNWAGATIGACGAYGLARLLGRDALHGLLGRWGDRLNAVGARSGFLAILRLRLIAVVPFNLVNLASGFAGVSFAAYAAATAIGIIPGTVIYTYFADSLVAGAQGAGRHAFIRLGIASALLIVLSFAPRLLHRSGSEPASGAGS